MFCYYVLCVVCYNVNYWRVCICYSVSPSTAIRCSEWMVILIRYMVILIWSRYCVLNIPPCQARPVIALSQNHLFYIQYTFDIFTMNNGCSVKPHINHQNQHFIWSCHKLNWEWISSGFAHKSSKERDWEKCNGLWSKHCKPEMKGSS